MGRLVVLQLAGEVSEGSEFVGCDFWLTAHRRSFVLIVALTRAAGIMVNCLITEVPPPFLALLPAPNATQISLAAFIVVVE
jgi:hypothetical protein